MLRLALRDASTGASMPMRQLAGGSKQTAPHACCLPTHVSYGLVAGIVSLLHMGIPGTAILVELHHCSESMA